MFRARAVHTHSTVFSDPWVYAYQYCFVHAGTDTVCFIANALILRVLRDIVFSDLFVHGGVSVKMYRKRFRQKHNEFL